MSSTMQEELKNELEELEQEQLNDRLMGAERAPVHALPATHAERRERESCALCLSEPQLSSSSYSPEAKQIEEEDDEEAQLRQLQAEMAM